MVRTVTDAPCASFQGNRHFQSVQIVRIDDGFNTFSNEVTGLGIEFYLGGIGDLFDEHNDVHVILLLFPHTLAELPTLDVASQG